MGKINLGAKERARARENVSKKRELQRQSTENLSEFSANYHLPLLMTFVIKIPTTFVAQILDLVGRYSEGVPPVGRCGKWSCADLNRGCRSCGHCQPSKALRRSRCYCLPTTQHSEVQSLALRDLSTEIDREMKIPSTRTALQVGENAAKEAFNGLLHMDQTDPLLFPCRAQVELTMSFTKLANNV